MFESIKEKYTAILGEKPHKIVLRDGEDALKVFDNTYKMSNLLNEALNQSWAFEAGLPVPEIKAVFRLEGCPAIRLDYIEGDTLADLMKQHPDRMGDYLEQFVAAQLDIFSHEAASMKSMRYKLEDRINRSHFDSTIRYELLQLMQSQPSSKVVCHGDFVPSNIIVKEDGSMVILDWSHATQGNAEEDVALTYLLFILDGQDKLGEQYLKLYCDKTSTPIQRIQRWMPIAAAAQTVRNEDDFQILERWVNVVDY